MNENDRKRYSQSFMSNAKWRRFFKVVNVETIELNMCTWKLVNEENPLPGHLPDYQHLGDDYVGDCGALNGPFPFQLIEWLFIPAKHGYQPYDKAPMQYESQNLEDIRTKIDSLGLFEYEKTDEGLKIFGYKV